MPKRVKEINPFHGGINNKDDQRDINETQLVEALNVKADSKGTLKIIGNLEQIGSDWTGSADSTSNVSPGYGLFAFSSDADASGNSGTDTNNTDYLIAWSEATEKFYWWNGSAWAEALDASALWSDNNKKPVFSYANGNLRVCDSNYNNASNENLWLGYIKRHLFKGSNAASNISQWYSITSSLAAPSAAPAVKLSSISADSDTTADDISWAIGSARENTTLGTALSDDTNSIGSPLRWIGSSNETNTDQTSGGQQAKMEYGRVAVTDSDPYGTSADVSNFRIVATLANDDVWADTGYVRSNTATAPTFTSGFTINTTGSVYVTVKLPDQATFDAWNGGFAASGETTVMFRNFKVMLYNGTTEPPTQNKISWNIPASELSKNQNDWIVLELPYDQADENDLSGTTIDQVAFGWDTSVLKSGSDNFTSAYNEYYDMSALYACDVRVGEEGLVGNDLLGNRELAYSFQYDDKKSESTLRDLGTINFGNDTYTYSKLIQAGARSFANKRITGAVLYSYEEEDPYMIAELDFVKGLRGSWETEFPGTNDSTSQWTNVQSNSVKSNSVTNDIIPLIETYQARNGFSHKQDSIDARYKSIVITNNRAYVGNVRIDGVNYPDRMIKSQAFDYDAFPEEGRSIEVVQQDGDSIVHLSAYADRLFQFKRNKLHVINITSEQEFLEDSHTGLGVAYPYHTVEMSTGIAWFNKNGAYYFDGKQINNITNGLIKDEDWESHVTNAGSKAQIFYSAKEDKLIVVGGTNGVDFYEYTIFTGGWTRGKDILENTNYTNFVYDVDNSIKTFKPSTGYIQKWSDNSTASKSDFKVTTGDLVFDSSAVRKKIYSVHLTHRKAGGTNIFEAFGRPDRAGVWTNLGTLNNYSDFTVQEFDVSGVNNARSYQVKVEARNLVTNGYFGTNTTGWNADGTADLSVNNSNQLVVSSKTNASLGKAMFTMTTVSGTVYRVTGNFYKGTSDQGLVSVGTSGSIGSGELGSQSAMTSDTEFNFTFTASGTTTYLILYEGNNAQDAGDTTIWDNISVKAENVPTDFEINDINIVYRSKNVR